MIYTKFSVLLLLATGLAETATAFNPLSYRGLDLAPRQFGGKGKTGGKGAAAAAAAANAGNNANKVTGNNANNNANTGNKNTNNASTTANNNNGNNNNANNQNALQLDPNNVQDASDSTGQTADAEAGQADSDTDPANFINVCTGKTLTNGAQVKGGSCNGITMGDIPSSTNMVSSIIVSPAPGENIQANQDFTVQVQTANLQAGSFTNPDNTYYAAPQALSNGQVVGHTHVTIQDLGNSLSPSTAPDAAQFAFFKGINDDGNGQGLLSADVTGGLPAGNYRVCTMSSASNHQPVLMPVAQRGAQDDCTKFTVGQANNNNGNTANNNANTGNTGNTGNNANTGNTGKAKAGANAAASSAAANTGKTAAGKATTGKTAAAAGKKGGKQRRRSTEFTA